jgi:tetratricopeptide (TPR) repeat protein
VNSPSQCPSCGAPLEAGDRFCPSCGRRVEGAKPEAARGAGGGEQGRCPFCGQANDRNASTCSACGAKIGDAPSRAAAAAPTSGAARSQGIGIFQSWKFTLGIGAVLVAALILLVATRQTTTTESAQTANEPHDARMMQRIRELQSQIDAQPQNAAALLEFANLLYDVQFFDRAAGMYERYLALKPTDPDARVDMGIAYFQMSFADTLHGEDLIARAETCFVRAIAEKPNHQLAHFNLGIVHLHRGDMAGANEWFRKCAAIDPNSEVGKRARDLMSQHLQNNPT